MADRTARLDTPARWAAALERARTKGVKLFRNNVTGEYSALSTDGKTLYSVSYYICGCKAGQGADPVCLHRAAFRAHLLREDAAVEAGLTAAMTPAPAPAPERECTNCLGSGMDRMYTGGRLNDYWSVHCSCPAGRALLASERAGTGVAA